MEIWKKIKDYEGYEISNYGQVKSLKNNKQKKLLKSINNDGYEYLNLCKKGKYKTFTIHRLVALAFINNPLKKETVNHINGIKTDNNINNLEWSTRQEQSIHSYKIGLQKKTNNQIVLNIETGIFYNSVFEASFYCNYKKSTLASKLNGTRKNNTNFIYV